MAAILIFRCTEGNRGGGSGRASGLASGIIALVPSPLSRFDTLPQVRLFGGLVVYMAFSHEVRAFWLDSVQLKIKMAAINDKTRSISTISRKNGGL